nr:hypothetical protein GCM10025730_45050 [Promicromonospora thailandica]
MSRIVAGVVGGRSIAVPAKGTRPTSDRVREAVFSRLEHLDVLDGARVLDLYAGSGALGLEAASRGAAAVTLVDSARPATDVARRNVTTLGLAGVRVVTDTAERFAAGLGGTAGARRRARRSTSCSSTRRTTSVRRRSPWSWGTSPRRGCWPTAPSSSSSGPPARRNRPGPRA